MADRIGEDGGREDRGPRWQEEHTLPAETVTVEELHNRFEEAVEALEALAHVISCEPEHGHGTALKVIHRDLARVQGGLREAAGLDRKAHRDAGEV